jgi:tetratricopeptide (TPR) repeat protein
MITLLVSGCATTADQASQPLPEGHPAVDGKSPIQFRNRQAEAYATFIRGVMLADEGKRNEALGYLQMSARLDSSVPAVHAELLNLYLETGNRAEAEKSARTLLELAPEQPEAHAAMGQLLLESGQAAEAVPYLEKAMELAPDKPGTSFILVEARERSGDVDGALELLQELSSAGENDAVTNFHIARILASRGDIEGALPHLYKAVQLNPSFLKGVEEIGNQLEQDKGPEEAEKLYRGYLGVDPDAQAVREFLARLLLRAERYSEARTELTIVLEDREENHGAKLLMGMVEYQDGNYERALEMFNQVRQMAPESFEMTMQIGTLQRELKMYEEAISTFEDAAALAPNRYEPFLSLAVIHDTTDDLDGACTDPGKTGPL